MTDAPVIRGDVRVFFLEGGGSPVADMSYEGFAIAGRPTYSFGDITNHYAPSPKQRRTYIVIAKTSGAETPPEIPITNIYNYALSKWLRLGRQKCDHDIQLHMGSCGDPQDANSGYEKILVLESARINTWGLDGNSGSLSPNDEGISNEEVTFKGISLYEVKKFDQFAQLGATTVDRPLVDGVIADSVSCGGSCGISSDGCSIVLTLSSATVGSAGAPPSVYFTDNGGGVIAETNVTSMTASDNGQAIGFDGTRIFVASSDTDSIHYASLQDILDASETWIEAAGNVVTGKGPQAIYVAGPRDIFFAALGGYIYKTSAVVNGPTDILSNGSLTSENLLDIHGVDDQHVAAVGENNSFLVTHDGETFSSVTGPAAGIDLLRVKMLTANKIFVAAADGFLYYTIDGGRHWATSGFDGQGSGTTHDVVFTTNDVGFLSHTTSGNVGRLFKTIDGGASWTILPELATGPTVPSHRAIPRIAPCDQNTIYAFGSSSSGNSGMWIKGS